MNNGMAAGTISERLKTQASVRYVGRLRVDVALQAQEPPFRSQEQMALHRSVRLMARGAALHAQCGMLVHERPALLGVARYADLKVYFSKLRSVQSAMSTVAICALHKAFRNPVVHWQGKLGLNRAMTTETKLRLLPPQQALIQPAGLFRERRRLREPLLGELQPCGCNLRRTNYQVRRMTLLARNACELVL